MVASEQEFILASCCGSPMSRNSVLEELRVNRLAATKSNVASTKSNVTSTMLPVASTLLLVWTGHRDNVHCSSMARWKAHGRLPICAN